MDPNYAYRWTQDSGNPISENGSTISFFSLKLSNAGKYTCEVNVSSDNFVDGYVTGMDSYNLSIKSKQILISQCCVNGAFLNLVPEPSTVMVASSPQEIYAESSFTIHCNITLSMDVKEVLGSLEIFVNWTGPGPLYIGMMASKVQQSDEYSLMYSTSISINSVDHSHDGNYTCAAQVAVVNSSYLITSSTEAESVEITISMLIVLSFVILDGK